MSAGAGICHSEVSTPATTLLHGVQLWIALPDAARNGQRGFDHYAPKRFSLSGAELMVFLGSLGGDTSPVQTFSRLLGAQIDLPVGGGVELDIEPDFEHAVLLDTGSVEVGGIPVAQHELACQGTGAAKLALTNTGARPARAMLLGGEPFNEDLLMWWNFVGRTHEEIVEYRSQWEAVSERFGEVADYQGRRRRIPAPPLPTTRLKPRHAPNEPEGWPSR